MKKVKAMLGMAAAGLLGASFYAANAQAVDVCNDTYSIGWQNAGTSRTCNLGIYGTASATGLSGYSNPGVKNVITSLTSENVVYDYTAYSYAQGYNGNNPIGSCVTWNDEHADGTTTSVPAGGDCSTMTRHRLVIGYRFNGPR